MYTVFLKELKELLRDRKTLFFVIALPLVVFPVIFALVGFLTSKAALEAQQKVNSYAIVNADYAKPFSEALFYNKSFKQVEDNNYTSVEELKAAVREGKIDAGIYIEKPTQEALERGEQSQWQVVFNDSQSINFLYNNLKQVTDEYAKSLQKARFVALGVTEGEQEALLDPIILNKVDTADKRENIGEKLGAYLPYILLPLILTGAMYPAIDLGAGEKERGTLETLLLTPLTRTQVVLGKFFTVLVSSIATVLVTVFSLGFWVSIAAGFTKMNVLTQAFGSLGVADFLMILMLLLPVAAIFSSLVLAISIYARTFKEAQNYMTPLSFGVFVPLIVAVLPNTELTAKTALIPITNVSLAIKEILKGTVDMSLLGLIFASTAVLAGALLAFCAHWFNREEVLFR